MVLGSITRSWNHPVIEPRTGWFYKWTSTVNHGGDKTRLYKLIQLLHTVHGKKREFTTELIAILQREALLQHANLSKANNDLIKAKEGLERRLRTVEKNLADIQFSRFFPLPPPKKTNLTVVPLSASSGSFVRGGSPYVLPSLTPYPLYKHTPAT